MQERLSIQRRPNGQNYRNDTNSVSVMDLPLGWNGNERVLLWVLKSPASLQKDSCWTTKRYSCMMNIK